MAQAAVLSNVDLVRHVLSLCTGATTIVESRKTCTVFRDAATDDVLRAVAHWRTLPRNLHPRLAPPTCVGCKKVFRGTLWSGVEAYCNDCRCITLLPLPRPKRRQITEKHAHYDLPCNPKVKAILAQMKINGMWHNKHVTSAPMLCAPTHGHFKIRICGRLQICTCGAVHALACFHAGKCMWTPFSDAA